MILFTLFFQFLPLNLKIFAIFPQKMLILTIFSQRSAISKNFPLLKVKIWGKFFTIFSLTGENINFFYRIFTYGSVESKMVNQQLFQYKLIFLCFLSLPLTCLLYVLCMVFLYLSFLSCSC